MRALYVTPGELLDEELRGRWRSNGIDSYMVRTGFRCGEEPPGLAKAIRSVRSDGARVWLVVGTWWGIGVEPGEQAMRSIWKEPPTGYPAHEAQWPMYAPGGCYDDHIERCLLQYADRYEPDGLLLTHARFRHPADVSGMFEFGEGRMREKLQPLGLDEAALAQAWRDASARLAAEGAAVFLQRMEVEEPSLAALLDGLTGAPVFASWLTVRSELVEESLQRWGNALRNAHGVGFGVNALCPACALYGGQRYAKLLELCDLVQPLLGYVNWHMLQPIGAWSRWLHDHLPGLDAAAARAAAARLLGFGQAAAQAVKGFRHDPSAAEESDASVIERFVSDQLALCSAYADQAPGRSRLMPVLRGSDWPEVLFRGLASRAESQFEHVAYQGATYWSKGEEELRGTTTT